MPSAFVVRERVTSLRRTLGRKELPRLPLTRQDRVMTRPRVALVHDYLTQRGGAERVVLSMLKAFPGAPLYTSLYNPGGTFAEFAAADVRPLTLNRIHVFRRHHRAALPFLAPAFSSLRVDAETVVCSSSGWAHGARATGRKVVYCYTPARWLYQGDRYLRERGLPERAALAALRGPLLGWDKRAAASADRYLTSSSAVKRRIREAYGLEADVLPPPQTLDPYGLHVSIAGIDRGFFLCVSRLLPYKHVDAVIEAFGDLESEQLVVVGRGPEERRLRRLAPPNVTLVGGVSDAEMRWLYAQSAGLVAASHEDYGLTPLEAAAFGKPSAVLRFGGFLDTVVADETGLFFERPAPADIAAAVRRLRALRWDQSALGAHAASYSEDRFVERLRAIVADDIDNRG
ncbi:MAG: glycosyltransferase [Gaiellaceae bacterium]